MKQIKDKYGLDIWVEDEKKKGFISKLNYSKVAAAFFIIGFVLGIMIGWT